MWRAAWSRSVVQAPMIRAIFIIDLMVNAWMVIADILMNISA